MLYDSKISIEDQVFLMIFINMLVKNILNSNKKIQGMVFHIFYPDLHTSILFDNDLSDPIIFGSKNIVMTNVKILDKLLNVPDITKICIYSYILTTDGYRRIDTYKGPINTIGKYIRRY